LGLGVLSAPSKTGSLRTRDNTRKIRKCTADVYTNDIQYFVFFTYLKAFKFFDMGYAAALGIIMLFITARSFSVLAQLIIGMVMRTERRRS